MYLVTTSLNQKSFWSWVYWVLDQNQILWYRPALLQMYLYMFLQNCFIWFLVAGDNRKNGFQHDSKLWGPVAVCMLTSPIPVGIRIIQGDHSFLSEHKCPLPGCYTKLNVKYI